MSADTIKSFAAVAVHHSKTRQSAQYNVSFYHQIILYMVLCIPGYNHEWLIINDDRFYSVITELSAAALKGHLLSVQ